MNNWWLAALEHFGLVTHEEAEHIAGEIKNSIHKEGYLETYEEFEGLLGKAKDVQSTVMVKLQAEVADLRSQLTQLKEEKKPIASPKKT